MDSIRNLRAVRSYCVGAGGVRVNAWSAADVRTARVKFDGDSEKVSC